LAAVGLYEVQEEIHWKLAVPGSARGEKKHGIFLANRIGLLDFMEEVSRVGELRVEVFADLFADGVAAIVYARADGSLKVARTASKLKTHYAYAFFDDALDCPAPAGMENSDGRPRAIYKDDRQAVRSNYGQQQAWRVADHAVADERRNWRSCHQMDEIGMNLANRNDGPRPFAIRSKFGKEGGTVSFNRGPGIGLGEAEIKRMASVGARIAAWPCRKSVNEPGKLLKTFSVKDCEFRVRADPGWHALILICSAVICGAGILPDVRRASLPPLLQKFSAGVTMRLLLPI
jgi:hypothetical protein